MPPGLSRVPAVMMPPVWLTPLAAVLSDSEAAFRLPPSVRLELSASVMFVAESVPLWVSAWASVRAKLPVVTVKLPRPDTVLASVSDTVPVTPVPLCSIAAFSVPPVWLMPPRLVLRSMVPALMLAASVISPAAAKVTLLVAVSAALTVMPPPVSDSAMPPACRVPDCVSATLSASEKVPAVRVTRPSVGIEFAALVARLTSVPALTTSGPVTATAPVWLMPPWLSRISVPVKLVVPSASDPAAARPPVPPSSRVLAVMPPAVTFSPVTAVP